MAMCVKNEDIQYLLEFQKQENNQDEENKEDEPSKSQNVLEKNTGPPLFFDLISSPFLVCFE
jgi:hypothetical protein